MNATNTQASGPRLPLVTEPTDPEAIAQFASIRARTGRILNLHRMMGHSPAMMKASADTAMALRHGTQLPRSLIDNARGIIRIWRRTGARKAQPDLFRS